MSQQKSKPRELHDLNAAAAEMHAAAEDYHRKAERYWRHSRGMLIASAITTALSAALYGLVLAKIL